MTTQVESGPAAGVGTLGRILRSHEFVVIIVIVAVSILITVLNPAFASLANVFDILRLATVNGMFGLAVLLVLISGGIDVSFTAIANLTSFAVLEFVVSNGLDWPPVALFGLAILFGIALGLVNGFFIAQLKITALIVTLGTSSLYFGASSFFLGTIPIINYPPQIANYTGAYIATVATASGIGTSSLHLSVVILIVLAVGIAVFLNKTALGRSVYAVGGSPLVAARAGINVRRVYYVVYGLAGAISAIAGVTYSALSRVTGPISLQGTELVVIAGTVLGGVSIWGGAGSVQSAMLGILLLTIVQNSLVLVGLPNTWQLVAVGAVLVLGTILPSWRAHRRDRLKGRAQL